MKKGIFYCLLLGIMGISCRSTFDVEPASVSVNELLGTWKMVQFQDLDTKADITQPSDPLLGEMRITFKADGIAGGRVHCNSMGFEYSLQGNLITIKSGFTTKVGCNTDWVDLFFKVFENPANTPFIRINGNTLTLISSNQKRKVTMIRL